MLPNDTKPTLLAALTCLILAVLFALIICKLGLVGP